MESRSSKPFNEPVQGATNCTECANSDMPCHSCATKQIGEAVFYPQELPASPSSFIEVAYDEDFGVKVVAAKDIKKGTIILVENPIVTAPFYAPLMWGNKAYPCAGCFMLGFEENMIKCSRCGWLVCSKECEKDEEHKRSECVRKIPFDMNDDSAGTNALAHRIAALKVFDSPKYDSILKMNRRSCGEKLDTILETFKETVYKALRSYMKLEDVIDHEEFKEIYEIIRTNSIGLTVYSDDDNDKRIGMGLYQWLCLMPHSCIPNCGILIQPSESRGATVFAAVNIKQGEPLTRFYRDKFADSYLVGTAERQKSLLAVGIICKCSLCTDPTENGTNMSTLKCSVCKNYSLLPRNPRGQALLNLKEWKWHCQTPSCSGSIANSELADLHAEILAISKKLPLNEETFKKCSPRWKKLKDYETRVHPNYWAIVSSAREICRQYCNVYRPPLSSPDWKYHQEILEYLLQIYDVIRPGLSFERSRILHALAQTKFLELFKRDLEKLNDPSTPPLSCSSGGVGAC